MDDEDAKEKAIEEWLRKKAAEAKRKKKEKQAAPSAQPAAELSDDIYLTAFHAGTSFEMLGDPAKLVAWWSKKQKAGAEYEKLMVKAQRASVTAEKRNNTVSKRNTPSSSQRKWLLNTKIVGVGPWTDKWVPIELNDRWE